MSRAINHIKALLDVVAQIELPKDQYKLSVAIECAELFVKCEERQEDLHQIARSYMDLYPQWHSMSLSEWLESYPDMNDQVKLIGSKILNAFDTYGGEDLEMEIQVFEMANSPDGGAQLAASEIPHLPIDFYDVAVRVQLDDTFDLIEDHDNLTLKQASATVEKLEKKYPNIGTEWV